jgi:hypothetical protein
MKKAQFFLGGGCNRISQVGTPDDAGRTEQFPGWPGQAGFCAADGVQA